MKKISQRLAELTKDLKLPQDVSLSVDIDPVDLT